MSQLSQIAPSHDPPPGQGGWLSPRRRGPRRGYTLLELLAAAAIVSATITPALALMRDNMVLTRKIDDYNLLVTLGVGVMERQLALAAADFAESSSSGDFGSLGRDDLHYQVTQEWSTGAGGIPDRLLVIQVTTWRDGDGDGALNSEETRVQYSTKAAR